MKKLLRATALSVALLGVSSLGSAAEHEEAQTEGHSDHGHDHVPQLSDVNWVEGVFSREEGTPVPLIALLLNTAVLAYLVIRFGGPSIKDGLLSRRKRILSDVDAAQAMKQEAEKQLQEYEARLKRLEAETEEIRRSMAEQSANERQRVLAEAEGQRQSMIADAEARLVHELRTQREQMVREVIAGAMQLAEEQLARDTRLQHDEQLVSKLLASIEGVGKSAEVRS